MLIIIRKGEIKESGKDWDLIENYAAKNKTKVTEVRLLQAPAGMGKLWVHWKDGAVGTFDADSYSDMLEYVNGLKGWPKAHCPPGVLPSVPFFGKEEEEPPREPEPAPEPIRVRRTRRKQ